MTNTLAYNTTVLITTVKRFISEELGHKVFNEKFPQMIQNQSRVHYQKCFKAVIYECSQ
jgi:hypothetical protein